MPTYTLTEAATALDKPARTISGAAARAKIGKKHGRSWLFTAADVETLRSAIQDRRGRPSKAAQ